VPVPGREDRDALNAAIRRASGRGEQESDDQPYRWKSIKDGAGDESDGT